jgi:cytochrome o ubiquinol oxidase subunit II
MMKKNRYKFLKGVGLLIALALLTGCSHWIVLESKGPVGLEEAFLIKIAFLLMLIVVLPVFVMVFWFAYRYRATNTKATYKPKWTHSTSIEWVIWIVPIAIVAALSYLTWVKTYELDPYKPLKSDVMPVRIEVVSTDWNWLFIYPDYNIAVVNQVVFPVNTPLSFRITSASVMTSFFIPQLGSQMYAMAGMQTRLNLMANDTGVYEGHNQEYSGNGYVNMHFEARTITQAEFEVWIQKAKQSSDSLSMERYHALIKPNVDYPITIFSHVKPNLFDTIVMEYMGWMGGTDNTMVDSTHAMDNMEGMHHMHENHDGMNMASDSTNMNVKKMEGK